MEVDLQQQFFERGCIWLISTSGYTGADSLNADDVGIVELPDIIVDGEAKLGSKYVLPKETRVKLMNFRSEIQTLMKRVAKPFVVGKSMWFVSYSKMEYAKERIDAIKARLKATIKDVVDNLEEIKAERIAQYPQLANARWKTPKEIEESFEIRIVAFEISGVNINKADPEELIALKRQSNEELKATMNEWKDLTLKDAQQAIINACAEITEKISKGEKITEATLKKPRRVVDEYLTVAEVFDLPQVKAHVNSLKNQLDGVNAETIRNSFNVAQEFALALENIGKSVGEITGLSSDGSVKRIVKREKEKKAA
jgi:hypothetical protein